jgi:hypothetical protein
MTIVIALILLAVAVGAIFLLLKNMGEDGVEIAAPGSCKSGRCGVRRKPAEEALPDATEESQRKDAA